MLAPNKVVVVVQRGCVYRESVPITAQNYPISIGSGGTAGAPGGLNPGSNGTPSTALGFTSQATGGSGGSRWHRGGSGGSAGGGTAYPPGGGGSTLGANPHPGGVDDTIPDAWLGTPRR